jgi:hypothetical protein
MGAFLVHWRGPTKIANCGENIFETTKGEKRPAASGNEEKTLGCKPAMIPFFVQTYDKNDISKAYLAGYVSVHRIQISPVYPMVINA